MVQKRLHDCTTHNPSYGIDYTWTAVTVSGTGSRRFNFGAEKPTIDSLDLYEWRSHGRIFLRRDEGPCAIKKEIETRLDC